MKKLLLFGFLLISLAASAQIPHPGYSPRVFSYGQNFLRGVFDSALHIPNKAQLIQSDNDTTPQIFVSGDHLIGFWNGNYWDFGHGAGAGGSYTADEVSLHLTGTAFSIKSTYTGQPSINQVGTIVSGIWNSTAIADPYISSSANWNSKLSQTLNSAQMYVGNASNIAIGVSMSGDASMANTGAVTLSPIITAGSCTSCNLTFDAKGRVTVAANGSAGGGNPFADNTPLIKNNADNTRLARFDASVISTGTTRVYILPDATGTVDLTSNTATLTNKTIAAGSNTISGLVNANFSGTAAITNANLATMPTLTFKGNITGGSAVPVDLTVAQLTANLGLFTTSLQGAVPASGGGTSNFMRADGTWAAPASSGLTNQTITTGTSATVTGSNYRVRFDFTSAIAAFTLTLPASPTDGQVVDILGGGTLTYGNEITALTVLPNTGQTILGVPINGVTASDYYQLVYILSNTAWYRTH